MSNQIGILVEYDFEDAEVVYPFFRLQEEGYKPLLIGPKAGVKYTGKYGYPMTSEVASDGVSADDLCGLIMPGGWAPDRLRRDPKLIQLIKDMDSQGKPLAAICHGPWMLCSAKIIKGRRLTCFLAIKDDVENAGGLYEDSPVVVDNNLITSRIPADLPQFCRALFDSLKQAK